MTQAIYETFVRMSQPWINNVPLVEFHGSNGNQQLGADSFAADRYTETRLSQIVEDGMLSTIGKDAVDMQLNFSEDILWPKVFPAVFPNLLVNGAAGIGVGQANWWVGHNLQETADLLCEYIKHGAVDNEGYMPDFPCGGTVVNPKSELVEINKTGRGRIVQEAKYEISGREIRFTEFCFQTYIEPLIEQIRAGIEGGKITGVSEVANKSDKDAMLLSVTCDRKANPRTVLEQLLTYTDLRCQYNVNQMAVVSKTPVLMTLEDVCRTYVEHNLECIRREHRFVLDKTRSRQEVLQGLLRAVKEIDTIVDTIKKSDSSHGAREALMAIGYTEPQAKSIVDMRLAKLSHTEVDSIESELAECETTIAECEKVLGSEKAQKNVLGKRLRAISKQYGTPRKTVVEEREIVKVATKDAAPTTYGIIFADETYIKKVSAGNGTFDTSNDGMVYLFSTKGKMFRVAAKNIPPCQKSDKGKAVGTLVNLDCDEGILDVVSVEPGRLLLVKTKNGYGKAVETDQLVGTTQSKGGLAYMSFYGEDEVASIRLVSKQEHEEKYNARYVIAGRNTKGKRL